MYSKLAVVAVLLVAAAGAFADDFSNNCNVQKKFCQNGGVCHENVGVLGGNAGSLAAWKDPFCVCQAPYGGADCSRTIRECKDSPCQNGATCSPAACVAGQSGQYYDCFTCACAYGWTNNPSYSSGAGICDWKQTDLSCLKSTCANGGTCTTTTTSTGFGYSCACTAGWLGGSTGQLRNVAYNCTAPDCTVSDGACQNGGTCVGQICSCGFYGGLRCELPRFCDVNTCPDGQTCVNTGAGTGQCNAPAFCDTHTCINGGTCNNGIPGCQCPAPYDGRNSCNATLFCESNPCQNGGTCSNSPNTYLGGAGSCSCAKDWAGSFCEKPMLGCDRDKVACAPVAGSCDVDGWVSKCSCPGATAGGLQYYDCRCNSTQVSKCPGTVASGGYLSDLVCQNGGTCVESADEALCSCRTGFWGDKCQNYDNPCLNNPCENGGQCYVTGETAGLPSDDRFWAWRCRCKWPFYGKNCEKQAPIPGADGLAPVVCGAGNSPCQNGGTCGPRGYSLTAGNYLASDPFTGEDLEAEPWACSCPAPTAVSYGYKGVQCEYQIEQCSTTTCQNNGKCSNNGGGVSCNCPCGYAGDRCEFPATNINSNSVSQFANDGAGGVGYHLEFCSREPCQNGGTCYHGTDGTSFGCNCKSGWAGSYCQYTVRSSAAGVVPSLIAVAAAVAAAFALKH